MRRLFLIVVLASAMVASVAGASLATSSAGLNAQFMNWVDQSSVIHIAVFDDEGRPDQDAAAVPGRSPVVFGFEWGGSDFSVQNLVDFYIDNPDHDLFVSIDGGTAFSVKDGYQEPFLAVPGTGPRWSWDHDGDGLGDGNGNGIDDFDFPVLFWRWQVKHLDKGTHTFAFTYTDDGGVNTFDLDFVTVEVG